MNYMGIRKLRLLIIDDQKYQVDILSEMLKGLSCEVHTGSCGKDFKELTSELEFDLVFLDYLLPCQSGEELLKEFKKNNPNSKCQFVCTTASIYTPKDIVMFINMGYDDVLPKPYSPIYLKNIISKLR